MFARISGNQTHAEFTLSGQTFLELRKVRVLRHCHNDETPAVLTVGQPRSRIIHYWDNVKLRHLMTEGVSPPLETRNVV